jgi:RNA polymerase-binding transcription factor
VAGDPTALKVERARVVARLAALDAQFAAVVAASQSANLDDEHDPEGATVGFERAQVVALREQARAALADVDDALTRVRAGSYGDCVACGEPIAAERLAARPTARECFACSVTRNRSQL